MSASPMTQHGAFSWIELLTTDVNGAKRFYSELLGWTFEGDNSHGAEYTLAKVDGAIVAGVMEIPEQAKARRSPGWGTYVTVDDVDALIPRVEAAGGKVCLPPMDIPGLGRFMMIQDPQGALLSLITYDCTEKM